MNGPREKQKKTIAGATKRMTINKSLEAYQKALSWIEWGKKSNEVVDVIRIAAKCSDSHSVI
jgi:hypothetical protein